MATSQVSDRERYMDQDLLAFRCTERFVTVPHSLGDVGTGQGRLSLWSERRST